MSAFGAAAPSAATDRDTVRAGPIEVDRAPVTNARYLAFVEATGHRPPLYWPNGRFPRSLADHPVVGVDFFDALAFALWAKGGLPTELEWCLATGLEEQREFAWGDGFDAARCNTVRSGIKGTSPVGAFPGGVAPSGCVDLCGNVWELTCTPFPGDPECVIVKGGSWYDYPAHARLETRFRARVHKSGATVGFRLIYGRPLRLPAFLDKELVARCIAYRRLGAEQSAAQSAPELEFADLCATLREEAAQNLPALDLEPEEAFDHDAVDEALALFDAGAALERPPPDAPTKAKRRPEWVDSVWSAMTRLLAERPRTVFAVLCVAIGAVLGVGLAASREETPGRNAAWRQGAAFEEPRRPPIARSHRTRTGIAAGSRRPQARKTDRGSALEGLASDQAATRDDAERWLIWHADDDKVFAKVREALQSAPDPRTRSSLAYVAVAMQELRDGEGPTPRRVTRPPERGLVFVFSDFNALTSDELAKARRTAKAEHLEFTLVIEGGRAAYGLADSYAATLRDVDLFIDFDASWRKRMHVGKLPVLVGLRPGGRRAFLLQGRTERSRLVSLLDRLDAEQ